ncbi:hypothetical protein LNP74_19550 [Klebsiella pneumoniae subsp. pneumoniae]|nr:hypothetical protein [Klebsiella pneumoniae subsp. pneumoniae]
MSTKKPLPPPPAPQKKDDGRDRIRAALAGSAARTTESVVGEVLLIDGEFVRLINLGSGKEKLRGMSGFLCEGAFSQGYSPKSSDESFILFNGL